MTQPGSEARPGTARRRRVDPQGKQALFSAPVTAPPDQLTPGSGSAGRDALFSTGPARAGTVVVECSACLARTRVSLLDLGVRMLSISAWLPVRRHPHWLRCPACAQHTWCRIAWNA